MRKKIIIAVCICIIMVSAIILTLFFRNNIKKNDMAEINTTGTQAEEFVVSFIDFDNSEICTVSVKDGENAHPPQSPEREGYIFRGWDKELTNIHKNMTICAMYETINVPAIVADSLYVSSDEKTVSVKISILNNPGIASLLLDVRYDDILTLEKIDYSSSFGEYVTSPQPYSNPQTISMISPIRNVDNSGEFAVMTFSVKDDAFVSESLTADISIMYNKDNTFDSDFNNILFETVNGKITIIK